MPSPFSFLQLRISKGDEYILRTGIILAFPGWAGVLIPLIRPSERQFSRSMLLTSRMISAFCWCVSVFESLLQKEPWCSSFSHLFTRFWCAPLRISFSHQNRVNYDKHDQKATWDCLTTKSTVSNIPLSRSHIFLTGSHQKTWHQNISLRHRNFSILESFWNVIGFTSTSSNLLSRRSIPFLPRWYCSFVFSTAWHRLLLLLAFSKK